MKTITEVAVPGRPPARLIAKRHQSRQRKLSCECGFICYASAGAVVACGLPVCGCGRELTVANPRDLAVIDPDGFEDAANGMPTLAGHNALMRAGGFTDSIIRGPGHDPAVARRRALRMKRCSSDACGRFARKGSPYCGVHAGAADMPF